MDFVRGGKGHEERSKKILEEWEKELEREADNRRNRQSREDDDMSGDKEEKS